MQQYRARHLISIKSTLDKMSIYATVFSYYALLVHWFAAAATVQLHILMIQDYDDHYGMCHCSKKEKPPTPSFFCISVSPHVLPHIKYSKVLPLEISIINKQNSCFCFEMEHHAGLERKHIYINLWFPIFLESRDTYKTPTLFPTNLQIFLKATECSSSSCCYSKHDFRWCFWLIDLPWVNWQPWHWHSAPNWPGTAENICFGLFPTARMCADTHKHTHARKHTNGRAQTHT